MHRRVHIEFTGLNTIRLTTFARQETIDLKTLLSGYHHQAIDLVTLKVVKDSKIVRFWADAYLDSNGLSRLEVWMSSRCNGIPTVAAVGEIGPKEKDATFEATIVE